MAARSAPSCGLVPLHHAGRDAPALTDHDAVVFRPRPDVTAVLPAGLSTSRSARLRSPGLAGVLKVRRELLAERGGVAGPEVDLIAGAIDGEPDGLIGRAAVEVVFEDDGYFLGHPSLPAAVVLAPYPGPRPRPSRNASDQRDPWRHARASAPAHLVDPRLLHAQRASGRLPSPRAGRRRGSRQHMGPLLSALERHQVAPGQDAA